MSDIYIDIPNGETAKLLTNNKICLSNIVVSNIVDNTLEENGLAMALLKRDSSLAAYSALPDDITAIGKSVFVNCENMKITKLPANIKTIDDQAFSSTPITVTELPEGLEFIGAFAFSECNRMKIGVIPSTVKRIEMGAFQEVQFTNNTLTFYGTPEYLYVDNAGTLGIFSRCYSLQVINVPWSEGAIPGAPWGAEYATINYNYRG